MEFWGVEVKSGTPLNVQLEEGMVIHLSQASIGEVKANKNEIVSIFVNVDGKKLVLGTLLSDKLPQQLFDLVFDRDFELSHNSKSGKDEDIRLVANNDTKAKQEKPVVVAKAKENNEVAPAAAGKQKVKIVEPTKDVKPEEEDDDSEEDDSDEDATSDGDLMDEDDESDSEDEDSEDADETPVPKKETSDKKRGAESAIKTPVPEKKAKLLTPQKTDGKKSGHVATPHPSKKAGKTPADKGSQQQTPKSGGVHSCGPCNRTFGSESALQSHTKAKHSAGK
ncbi:hypothetical protein LIER_08330 [Lithospermum erythrorhizon]|uniref:C2H2-type domain-containing protein n=1 Tax=Lithospermum erythrorhizon TaxID=34254 RepID=A0AAV3PBI7_LITER